MTTVSLAAQLITFPLAVYYFHQFPVYFLPANLLLIPLASLILYGGILLLPLSATGPPAVLLVAVLEKLIDIMNLLMQFLSRLPGAVLGGIWIDTAEWPALSLLYGFMILFVSS